MRRLVVLAVVSLHCVPPPEPPPPGPIEVVVDADVPITVHVFATQLVRVSWASDGPQAASLTASWGDDRLEVVVDEGPGSHAVDFIGPPPAAELSIVVEGDDWVTEAAIVTPEVPRFVPRADVVTEAEPADVGWTLTNIVNQAEEWPASAVIYDARGRPIWHYTPEPDRVDTRGDLDVRWTADGTVLIGPTARVQAPVEVQLDGTRVWEGPVLEPFLHHHFDKLADGTYVALQQARPTDAVLILDADHAVTWSWVAHEHLKQPVPPNDRDFLHLNSVWLEDEHMYVSSRDLSTIFKVDRQTGAIVWRLGRGRDFTLVGDGTWFRFQHDPARLDDDRWLVYDNRAERPSRVVELAVDESAMTAEVVWTFPGEAEVDAWYTDTWFSPIWGDADRRPNGWVRVTNGNRFNDKRSRIFDVRRDGTVAWAIDFDVGIGSYRAQPLVPRGGLPGLPPQR